MSNPGLTPIPSGIRVVMRNAGEARFFERGVHDLFQSRDFTERGEAPAYVEGFVRVLIEEYQAVIDWASPDQRRRYLELVEDFLAQVSPGSAEDIRRELGRAGLQVTEDNRVQEPPPEVDLLTASSDPTEGGIWPHPEQLRVFMSHTSAHKTEVKALADALEATVSVTCFVAHVDITPSAAWQTAIERALATCDVLMAYVTEDFKESKWTDQEVGWVLGRGLPVIPIRVDLNPYGFFGSYQAVPHRTPAYVLVEAVVRAMCDAVYNPQRPQAAAIAPRLAHSLVGGFCRSGSFDTTRARLQLLERIPRRDWTPELARTLREAASTNTQIFAARIQPVSGGPSLDGPAAIEELLARNGLGTAP